MHGHPIAKLMENWWKDHGQKDGDPKWENWFLSFEKFLEQKKTEWMTAHFNPSLPEVLEEYGLPEVFGMARAAGCTRASELSLLGFEKKSFTGSELFTFWLGHIVEIATLATLEQCGYEIYGTQEEVFLGKSMSSASDGKTKIMGIPTIISVKSTGYKQSSYSRTAKKQMRRGFAELPFEGIRKIQPSWYLQAQAEMAGAGYKQALIVAASKDMIKAYESDVYLGAQGNGSLTFYAEVIQFEPELAARILMTHEDSLKNVIDKKPGPALYYVDAADGYIELEKASFDPKNIWGGPNQKLTGKFNPCGGCSVVEACRNN